LGASRRSAGAGRAARRREKNLGDVEPARTVRGGAAASEIHEIYSVRGLLEGCAARLIAEQVLTSTSAATREHLAEGRRTLQSLISAGAARGVDSTTTLLVSGRKVHGVPEWDELTRAIADAPRR